MLHDFGNVPTKGGVDEDCKLTWMYTTAFVYTETPQGSFKFNYSLH